MKEIKVQNYNGNEYEGKWNGKTYASAVQGRPELLRIYIDNEPVHITEETLNQIVEDKADYARKKAEEKVDYMFSKLSTEEKEILFFKIYNDDKFRESISEKRNISFKGWKQIADILCK